MRLTQNRHLTFCTNIYPGKDWETTLASIKNQLPKIKEKLSPEANFGLGLRLSNTASEELGFDDKLSEFKQWLDEHGIYVFTMNGFPYGAFHDEVVKDKVHAPDWTTRKRLTYTKRLAQQLAFLLPDGVSGGISTSPISYRHWHNTRESTAKAFATGTENLIELTHFLQNLKAETGKRIHIDIEPEPDGLLENSDEVIDFYNKYLFAQGEKALAGKLAISKTEAAELIKNHLQVCYDICHFSLAYEEPEQTFQKFSDNGIKIGKIQVSSALKIRFDHKNDQEIWKSLARFNEPTYLHQVTTQENGKVVTYNDLPIMLSEKGNFSELRAHFHVPIFMKKFDLLDSTQDYIIKTFDYLKEHQVTRHLEVETYTWDVLPKELKIDLNRSIVRELKWAKKHMEYELNHL